MASQHPLPAPNDIERFGWVEPWLARGAQPNSAGYKWLAGHGVGVVVNLREADCARDVERSAPSLQSVHLPVKNDRPPADDQVAQWFDLCDRIASGRPIFVHCKGGEGRTSVFCALTRLRQGWSVEDAIAEQIPYGFNPEKEHKHQAEFLREFAGHFPHHDH